MRVSRNLEFRKRCQPRLKNFIEIDEIVGQFSYLFIGIANIYKDAEKARMKSGKERERERERERDKERNRERKKEIKKKESLGKAFFFSKIRIAFWLVCYFCLCGYLCFFVCFFLLLH